MSIFDILPRYSFITPLADWMIDTFKNLQNHINKTFTCANTAIQFLFIKSKLNLLGYMNCGILSVKSNNDVKVHHLNFYDGTNLFSMVIPRQRGPRWYTHVTCNDQNVTKKIHQYAGPCHNFYGIATTPNMLGYPSLTFHTPNGSKTYKLNEVIYPLSTPSGPPFGSTSSGGPQRSTCE